MPIIRRIETDMFRFAGVCDYMVNPVNLVGAPGAGLAKKFSLIYPDFVPEYRKACQDKTLKFGTIQVCRTDENLTWDIINLPTKDYYANPSDIKDIRRSVEALRNFLLDPKNNRSTIGLPMLGCGLGQQDYPTVEPVIERYLDSVDAITFLSMSPQRTNIRPNYLVIMGPPRFGEKRSEREIIEKNILKMLDRWKFTWDDFAGVVSGGLTATEIAVCGSLDDQTTITKSIIHKYAPEKRMIAPANWSHNRLTAAIRHVKLLAEIGTHFILFMPPDYNNNRMIHVQKYISEHNRHYSENEYGYKRVSVLGKNTTKLVNETPVVVGYDSAILGDPE